MRTVTGVNALSFRNHTGEFYQDYHQRSNVEADFSAVKRVFDNLTRSISPTARVNEVLAKAVAYNTTRIIHASYIDGIAPFFSPNPPMDMDLRGEGVTGAMVRARIRVDGRLAGGLQALWGHRWRPAVAVASGMAGQDAARVARGPGWRKLAGRSVGWMTGQWQKGGVRQDVEPLATGPGRG